MIVRVGLVVVLLVAFVWFLRFIYPTIYIEEAPRNKYVRCYCEMSILNNRLFPGWQVPVDNFTAKNVKAFQKQLDGRKIRPMDLGSIADVNICGSVAVEDPWGSVYLFAVSNVNNATYAIRIWSCGPNGKNEQGEQDDILFRNDSGRASFDKNDEFHNAHSIKRRLK